MYVLTNIEVEATHKVLTSLDGPTIDNALPEGERRTLRNLIERMTTDIENGLPEGLPDYGIDNELPEPPATIDNELPVPPSTPDNELPEPPATPKS